MTIAEVLIALSHLSPWHADRARRLFTCGCPKQTVIDICRMESPAERDGRLSLEEQKLSLEEMAVSQSATPMEKVQADLAHAYRVIQRMESREKWFAERIEQLEVFSKRVAGELADARASASSTSCPSSPSSPKLTLQLGDVSLPDHERLAKNLHKSVLIEEGMEAGMTPIAPLLPIPTHSLQKVVSWGDLSSAPDPHKACILRGGGAGTHDDCPYCSNGQCTCGHSAAVHMDSIREKHGLGPTGEETPFLLPCPGSIDPAFANCSPFIRDLYKAGLFTCEASYGPEAVGKK
jgi:hypothetical protein